MTSLAKSLEKSRALGLQGCQMAYFQTKNPNLGKLWRALQWKMLVYFMAIWSILWLVGICCGQLVYFKVVWYIFPHFGMLYHEKSGNPGSLGCMYIGSEKPKPALHTSVYP
jgi:hypothetical protein